MVIASSYAMNKFIVIVLGNVFGKILGVGYALLEVSFSRWQPVGLDLDLLDPRRSHIS